jgi:RNA polymerase II subunit A small phosphatase-like protein
MTSSAVQAPGSGSTLLSTPVRPSSSRRQSGSSPSSASPEGEPTETSGGYSNISESEIPDESSGAAGAAAYPEEHGLEEEYEDDEDRLIAQGGIGIPVDEVSLTSACRAEHGVTDYIERKPSSIATPHGPRPCRS